MGRGAAPAAERGCPRPDVFFAGAKKWRNLAANVLDRSTDKPLFLPYIAGSTDQLLSASAEGSRSTSPASATSRGPATDD